MEYATDPPVGGRLMAWLGRVVDRFAPWALSSVVAALSVAAATGFRESEVWGSPPILVLGAACGASVVLARRWLWPLFAVAAFAWVTLAVWPVVMVASYYAGTSLRRRRHFLFFAAAALLINVLGVAVSLIIGGSRAIWGSPSNAVTGLLVFIGLPLVVGLWVAARRQVVAGLRERAERLEREHAARTDQARAEERARIAREMHDIVAHRVSLMVLHAGALEVNAADERTAREAELIRDTGREALANLREVLGVLRSTDAANDGPLSPQPMLADLDHLLDQSRAAGIPVNRRSEGTTRPVPSAVERAAYRIVQEALTNVHKHAGGVATEVVVHYQPHALELAIRNARPRVRPDPLPGSGMGIAGLRERVGLLGGRLEAGPGPGGQFVLLAYLPTREIPGSAEGPPLNARDTPIDAGGASLDSDSVPSGNAPLDSDSAPSDGAAIDAGGAPVDVESVPADAEAAR
ncbi:histidine kinase [Actinopolymorpha alba]|uniref:histidine kinase n=1 Tax=Actinopolymorpha alba TaxID=533267 RepID=UPI000368E383|nr:histidine kinase [Actinopolymorpha alba]